MKRHLARVAVRLGLAIGAASLFVSAPAPAATTRAAGIDLGALMGKALAHAERFEVVSDSSSTHAAGSPGGVMKIRITEIFIRRGSGYAMSMQVKTDGKVSALVYTGKHLCAKQSAAAAWNCTLPLSYVQGYLANMDPVKALKASGAIVTGVAAVGSRIIAGQACAGYRFADSLASIHYNGTGTIWFSLATGRVVRADSSGAATLVAGKPPMVTVGSTSYSHWNDPSLSLPTVPVS